MGMIGGLLGLGGGAGGSGFAAPVGADILQGVNVGDARWNYDQSQAGVQQQQQLLQALQGTNGLKNQTSALQAQQSLAGQQQGTASQYQNLANGVGPNPAQAQLAQNTAANVAQTGALMAGQRGGSQNVGLIARQAGQQGAATQQQAAGQAATLQAQQQIAGLQGLSAQQAQIGQTNQNVANIAGSQAANQIGQTNAITGAHQANYANTLNAMGAYNNALVGMQSNINSANAGLANTQMQGSQGLIGGLLNGGAASSLFSDGGDVVQNNYTPDTSVAPFSTSNPGADALAGKKEGGGGGGALKLLAFLSGGGEPSSGSAFPGESEFGSFLHGVQMGAGPATSSPTFSANPAAAELKKGVQGTTQGLLSGSGDSGSSVQWAGADSPGNFANLAAKGGDMRSGGKVKAGPGQKATKSGDSYANDKIPAVLSEHEIVLPRSVTLSDDPVRKAASFVQAVIAKRGRK